MIFFRKQVSIRRYTRNACTAAFLVLLFCNTTKAQDAKFDSLLDVTLAQDSLFLEELLGDSTFSVLDLIDSLIAMDNSFSSLSARLSYTSNVAYAGRDFGFQQHGFTAGISYYHKSGLYADISGYWNSDIDPNYNPTITTLGYMGTFGSRWSYIVDYDHYFYQKPETDELMPAYPITNSFNSSLYYDFKFLSPGLDYTFMFGDETAHRIRGSIIGKIKFRDTWIFDRISISPGASVMAGNQNIYYLSQNYQFNREAFFRELIDTYGWLFLRRQRKRNPDEFRSWLEAKAAEYGYYSVEEKNVFGIMNYSLSLPVFFSINNFSLALSYSINFPVALPGEDISYDPNSYFGVSLIYNLIFR